jgi:uncharacterized protein (DUF885 family)
MNRSPRAFVRQLGTLKRRPRIIKPRVSRYFAHRFPIAFERAPRLALTALLFLNGIHAAFAETADGAIDATSTPASAQPAASSQPTGAARAEEQQLDALYAAYWHDWLRLNPQEALAEGVTDAESQFDDSLEDAWLADMRATLHHYQSELARFDPSPLPREARISYQMLKYEIDQALSYYGSDLYVTARMLPINQFVGQHTAFALDQSGSGSYNFKTVADYDHALERADSFARWANDAIARLKEGVAQGVVLPRVVVERVLPQLQNYINVPAQQSEFWNPIANMPADFSAADRARLTKAYARKITTVIEPAFRKLHAYLGTDYLSHANAMPGLGALPNGAALYAYDVKANTTTAMSAEQIHALGLSEVQRITGELDKVRQTVHFQGTLPEFLASVRSDPAQHFQSPDEVIPAYRAALQRILPKLPTLFDVMPRAAFEIRALPDSAKKYQGNGNYQQAAADGSRPGILWINVYAPGIKDKFIVTTTTLHETYPGHHFQTSLAAEIKDLPAFRRLTFFNAYGEGWALYCESLGKELGLYDDPWQYYGHLMNEMLRANRLVIDTGIHAMGWTTEQGIAWMMDHSSMDHAQAAAEVERYVAYPAQALSYKAGQLEIRRLRTKAEQALGTHFDVRQFHDQILLGGSMPLTVLADKVDDWIAQAQAQAQSQPQANAEPHAQAQPQANAEPHAHAQAQPQVKGQPQQAPTQSQRFVTFMNDIYERNLEESPILAASFNSKQGYDRWDDLSPAAERERIKRIRADMARAKSTFDYSQLDERTQLQYRVFMGEDRLLLDRYRWRDHFYPMNQITGLQLDVPDVLTHQNSIADRSDAEAYIRHINGVKVLFEQFTAQIRARQAKGFFMPKLVYPLLIEQCRGIISGAPYDSGPDNLIWADFQHKLEATDLPESDKQALLATARSALLDSMQPAYQGLIALLQDQEAKTPITGGVWQAPDGDAFYAFLVRQFTTTDITPQQIHELGLREVARVHGEMQAVLDRVGFKGSVREFMAQAKADPKFYYANTDEGRQAFLERARGIVAAMRAKITDDFIAPPALTLRVERPEAYREASLPAGDYEPGSPDGKVPGTIYLNLSDMNKMPTYELEDLLYHEGIPGHHMQFSTILVDPAIPQLRKVNAWWQDTAFVEGWALYAEKLAKDMGFYQDPYADFGRLSGELWRACRLVVDSGIHYKHWTREQAIKYLDDNTPRSDSAREVDRYIAVPGQATSFMVGMQTFLDEREHARSVLGPAFDIRGFHDAALRNGFVPLWAMKESVASWIAEQQHTH